MLPRIIASIMTTVSIAKYKNKSNICEEFFAQKLAKITCFWKKNFLDYDRIIVKKKELGVSKSW